MRIRWIEKISQTAKYIDFLYHRKNHSFCDIVFILISGIWVTTTPLPMAIAHIQNHFTLFLLENNVISLSA